MKMPQTVTMSQFDDKFADHLKDKQLAANYCRRIGDHYKDGDLILLQLRFDPSWASYQLWNFFLSEERRLWAHKKAGKIIVAAMKDLGTIALMGYAFDDVIVFYPDSCWWLPCMKANQTDVLDIADSLGLNESLCPVRAMAGAFVNQNHFPVPDKIYCSTGATCDDFSVIASRLESIGFDIFWWEIPHRLIADKNETVIMANGLGLLPSQVDFVKRELESVRKSLESLAARTLSDSMLRNSIERANNLRKLIRQLRQLVFTSPKCPLAALEEMIIEMLAIHFCSDPKQAIIIVEQLIELVKSRINSDYGILDEAAVKVFWVNPAADLRVMNLLEQCGGRICGTDYMISHSIEPVEQTGLPMDALAMHALSDPMVGSAGQRADMIIKDIVRFDCEAIIISRIPGASHCASEGKIISNFIHEQLDLPLIEIEVPSICDSLSQTIRTRIEAVIEAALSRRKK